MASTSTQDLLRLRSYQHEMFRRSMQGNVIVAMDTGSGKTHVALLRIREEADRSPGKLIWFLAPTVALCEQQQVQINRNIPVLRTKLLIGSDNVDRWSSPAIWDGALDGVNVVISTHAVLGDALTHGFVSMQRLSLIVFDEAHHCNRDHPANKIMRDFYHPRKELYGPSEVPDILGLTASPIYRSNVAKELQTIESNLDAVGVTPLKNRDEMMKFVHKPELVELKYNVLLLETDETSSNALLKLKYICEVEVGMGTLTYQSGQNGTWQASRLNRSDEEQLQLWRFFSKAAHIFEELGAWAADYFISESITILGDQLRGSTDVLAKKRALERLYPLLNRPELRRTPSWVELSDKTISPKVRMLLQLLSRQDNTKCSGIVFVQQRVTASILCSLLAHHSSVKERFGCAPFVGTANNAAQKYGMTELLDLKAQREILAEFRSRKKNLIIATNALEEGIDVTACNLVICFSEPANVKSFIQRRGRARKEHSTFALFFPQGLKGSKVERWKGIEEELIRTYQDDQRKTEKLKKIESEEEEVLGRLTTSVAVITPKDSVSHLYHFCATLPRHPYAILEPVFCYQRTDVVIPESPSDNFVAATVDLPLCLDPSLRHFSSKNKWRTEKAARRDACFQAYCSLHNAGLLNEHLLPLMHIANSEGEDGMDDFGETVRIESRWKPWEEVAKTWPSPDLHQSRIRLCVAKSEGEEEDDLCLNLIMPMKFESPPPLRLFWDQHISFEVLFEAAESVASTDIEDLDLRRRAMQILIRAHRSKPLAENQLDCVGIISPDESDRNLSSWIEAHEGRQQAAAVRADSAVPVGFVRNSKVYTRPQIFQSWVEADETTGSPASLKCLPLPSRRNFVRRQQLRDPTDAQIKMLTFSIDECKIDRLPINYARFGMFIPTILQHIERCLIAERMRRTIFPRFDICSLEAMMTTLTAPSAAWASNNEEFAFFGATVLKYIVSFQLFCQYPMWHEGYLSAKRGENVSNQTLADAAIHIGLDRFIMEENTAERSRSLPSLTNLYATGESKRQLPAQAVADVVQALIGAAYLENGIQKAQKCIEILAPKIAMHPAISLPKFQASNIAQGHVATAEAILGYTFKKKVILLEALTHASFQADTHTSSWQRLSFLGDAVLDILVVSFLSSSRTVKLKPARMTHIKAALVNAQMLGFLCLDFGIEDSENEIVQAGSEFTVQKAIRKRRLWQLMRFDNTEIGQMHSDTMQRYEDLHVGIQNDLRGGVKFPWILLARLAPSKLFSDLIRSIIGAIFVDEGGSLDPCEIFIKRVGIWEYMERLVSHEVDLVHPKTILAQIAKGKKVERFCNTETSHVSGNTTHTCRIVVDGAQVSSISGCLSKDEAILTATMEAATCLRTTSRETSSRPDEDTSVAVLG